MAKKKIIFGCEASGHYYFEETGYAEAPLLVLMRVIEIMRETKKSLADLVDGFNKYYLERMKNLNCILRTLKKSIKNPPRYHFLTVLLLRQKIGGLICAPLIPNLLRV